MYKIGRNTSLQKALYQEKLSKDKLLSVTKNIHTTVLGELRIKRNLGFENTDVIEFCKSIIRNKKCNMYRQGKNYYFKLDNIVLTVNAKSYTVITAHNVK